MSVTQTLCVYFVSLDTTVTTRGGNIRLLSHVLDGICSVMFHIVNMYRLGHLLDTDHIMIPLIYCPVSKSTVDVIGKTKFKSSSTFFCLFFPRVRSRVCEFSTEFGVRAWFALALQQDKQGKQLDW